MLGLRPLAARAMVSSTAENPLDGVGSLRDVAGKGYCELRQACALIGISYQVGLKYIKPDPETGQAPRLRAVRVGGRWRVYEDELRRFLTFGNSPESTTPPQATEVPSARGESDE